MYKARDVMCSEVLWIDPDTSVSEAWTMMRDNGFRHLPVVDDRKLVGILSEGDIIEFSAGNLKGDDVTSTPVSHIMTVGVMTCHTDSSLVEVGESMLSGRIAAMPVVEDNELVGIITTSDFLKWTITREKSDEKGTGCVSPLRGLA